MVEYSDNYSGTTASLWQHHKDEPKNLTTVSNFFKFKAKFWIILLNMPIWYHECRNNCAIKILK